MRSEMKGAGRIGMWTIEVWNQFL